MFVATVGRVLTGPALVLSPSFNACVHLWACAHVCVCAHVSVYMWRSEGNPEYRPQECHPCPLRQGSPWPCMSYFFVVLIKTPWSKKT